ncbi:MAG: ACP S-malonyltransferase [Rubrobacteraceae bacterium]|nr:ACP S-malonyltransferase [Rubrobacter sp.]
MEIRRAIVFPGQGTVGGEVSGKIREVVRQQIGDGDVPYQLSVFARSVDLLYELGKHEITPDVVAGHSLGEYAAAHAAGSLSLEDGVRLVAERDRLMNEASEQNPGGMVAVIKADPQEVARAVEDFPEEDGVVVAANFNTPRQTVISGEKSALEAVGENIKGRKVPLEVAGAFHSPLMLEASLAMEYLLEGTEFGEPEIPMVSGVDGAVLATADDVRLALRNQMLSSVRWVEVIARFEDLGVREIVEAGEGGTLVRMLRDFRSVEIEGRGAMGLLA